ncbi:hypothetical protein [Schlesneria sp. DSM 10557]|uniref:hypothetical protein n=1 Tax=Schlesneria sp. DSM 10557 TaxID=3044399 RepID=UPI0035A016B2
MSVVSRRNVIFASITLLFGCRGNRVPYRKPTSKVTGRLVIDGDEPGSQVKIDCVPISEVDTDPAHFSVSSTMTQPDGSFEISTYQSGDGVPDGDYVLTITWGTLNLMSRSYGGPDKLKGRYSDPKKSEIKFTVEGSPVDLGDIELTTK